MRNGTGATMAPKNTRKRPAASPEIKQVGIRSRQQWADWLERAAAFCRTDTSKLIDVAVAEYVRARGFDEEPPPRL